MKKRNEIDSQYLWDVTDIISDDQQWYTQFEEMKRLSAKLLQYKGKLHDIDMIYSYICDEKDYERIAGKVYLYLMLSQTTDMDNQEYQKMEEMLDIFTTQLDQDTAYITIELHSLSDDTIAEILRDDRFSTYRLFFEDISRSKKHILDENGEKLLANIDFDSGYENIFDLMTDVDMSFDDIIDSDGVAHELNQSNFSNYLQSPDRTLRKNAFESFYRTFEKFSNTISANYISSCKACNFYRKVRKYHSLLEKELENQQISPKVYENLINNVNKHLPLLHEYWNVNKQILGYDEYHIYDTSFNPIPTHSDHIPYAECVTIAQDVLSILGTDYIDGVTHAITHRWIDVYPHEKKRSGGFQTDNYYVHPYIMLNYENKYNDVSTFVHEMGHAMHSYFSNHHQPVENADYPIFLAEIASTVNEILLIEYMIDHARSATERKYYIREYLQMYKSTIFRQTMFSEFEHFVFTHLEQCDPLNKSMLNDYYYALNKKYYGDTVSVDSQIAYEWMRIPHFYTPYYVYKYSTGLISAINLVEHIKHSPDGLTRYLQMISSGGSDYPTRILQRAGVDLETDQPYDLAFAKMHSLLSELKS